MQKWLKFVPARFKIETSWVNMTNPKERIIHVILIVILVTLVYEKDDGADDDDDDDDVSIFHDS